MYLDHFGLIADPFSLTPRLDFLFVSEAFEESIAHLAYGIENGEAIVLITGEIGTGKTLVLHSFLAHVGTNFATALVDTTQVDYRELLKLVLRDLGETVPPGADRADLLHLFKELVRRANDERRRILVVVDEAQNLSIESLEGLRTLTNIDQGRRQGLQLVLVGQPDLEQTLARPELSQLRQRIRVHYRLENLSRSELTEYVRHRLKIAGCERDAFQSRALDRIYQVTRGVPRLVNIMAGEALLTAYLDGSDEVRATHVDETSARGVPGMALQQQPPPARAAVAPPPAARAPVGEPAAPPAPPPPGPARTAPSAQKPSPAPVRTSPPMPSRPRPEPATASDPTPVHIRRESWPEVEPPRPAPPPPPPARRAPKHEEEEWEPSLMRRERSRGGPVLAFLGGLLVVLVLGALAWFFLLREPGGGDPGRALDYPSARMESGAGADLAGAAEPAVSQSGSGATHGAAGEGAQSSPAAGGQDLQSPGDPRLAATTGDRRPEQQQQAIREPARQPAQEPPEGTRAEPAGSGDPPSSQPAGDPKVPDRATRDQPAGGAAEAREPAASQSTGGSAAAPALYVIHVSSFRSQDRAFHLCDELRQEGLVTFAREATIGDTLWYRVFLGPFRTRNDARQSLRQLRDRGWEGYLRVMKIQDGG